VTWVQTSLLAVTGVALAISLVTDLRSRKILNVVTYPAILIGLAVHGIAWHWSAGPGYGLKWSLIGLAVGAGPLLLINLFNPKAFGLGDVKLLAAVGALMGWPFIFWDLAFVGVAGGLVAVVALLWTGRTRETLGRMFGKLFRRRRPEAEAGEKPEKKDLYVPYGVAIAFGTLWAFLYLRGVV